MGHTTPGHVPGCETESILAMLCYFSVQCTGYTTLTEQIGLFFFPVGLSFSVIKIVFDISATDILFLYPCQYLGRCVMVKCH